jgi:SAM-dependent methyltransferase
MARRDSPERGAWIGLYADAQVYDILHGPGTAEELRGLERIADRYVGRRRGVQTWLEPACGTGRLLAAAARRRGVRVVGFDLSEEMVAYARSRLKGRRGRVFRASMTGFAPGLAAGSVDFAFCTINTIRHLESDEEVLEHLRQVARVLRPGGVYAVGLSATMYGMESPSEDVWEGRRGRVRVKQVIGFLPPASGRYERAISHLVISRGRRREHRDSAYRLRCYSLRQWRSLLGRSAMEVRGVADAAGQPVEPPGWGYAIWVLSPGVANRGPG